MLRWFRRSTPELVPGLVLGMVLGLFLGLAIVGLLTPATALAKVKITYWTGWGGSELESLQKIIDEGFNKKRTDIEVETVTIFGAYEKLLAAIAGGQSPDVVSAVWDSQLASLAARGALLPLDNFARGTITPTDFWPKLWNSFYYEGKLYALALTTNAQFTAFNRAMARGAGLDPGNPPNTTSELDDWARKLTKFDSRGNISILGYRPTGIALWGRLFGGDLYDEANKRVTPTHPRIVDAMEWLQSYNKWLDPRKVDVFTSGLGNYWSPQNPFFAGKVAMQDYGEWIVQFSKLYNPNLDYGIFAYASPDGKGNSTLFGGSMFVIPANSKHPKEAWEFLKWITSPDPMRQACLAFTNMPPRMAIAKEKAVVDAIPVLKLTIPLMERGNAFTSIAMPVYEQYLAALTEAESAVINGGADPRAALEEVARRIQPELDRFLRRR